MGLKKLTATVASALVKAWLFQIFSEKYAKVKDGLQHKSPLFLQSGSSGSSETESSTLPPQPSSVCHPVQICCWKSQSTLGSLGPQTTQRDFSSISLIKPHPASSNRPLKDQDGHVHCQSTVEGNDPLAISVIPL